MKLSSRHTSASWSFNVGSKALLKISQIDFSRVDIMLLEKDVGDAWKKSQCPARMTNCSLKRSLKAVPTRTRNTLDPKALLWMTNRRSRCLDEVRSSLELIYVPRLFETSFNSWRLKEVPPSLLIEHTRRVGCTYRYSSRLYLCYDLTSSLTIEFRWEMVLFSFHDWNMLKRISARI